VSPTWGPAAVTSSGDGSYNLTANNGPTATPYELALSADGFVSRRVWVQWHQAARSGVSFDLIRNSPPFSMEFYQQLVRGTFDAENAPWPVFRLSAAPSFYVQTVDQNGRAVEPEVLPIVLDALARAVPAFTGGKFSAAAIETGTEARPATAGWINVLIRRDPTEKSTCGFAWIGRETGGEITLNNDVCSCGSNKIPGTLVMHEVGHALGFFHVSDRSSVMYPFIPGNCPAGSLSAAESYHSAIAYTRPRGNTAPDNDPTSGRFVSSGVATGPGIRIKN
jgi:hypothetical protein